MLSKDALKRFKYSLLMHLKDYVPKTDTLK